MSDCPNCGLAYQTARSPGFENPWQHPKVMLQPCTCVVDKETLASAPARSESD